MSGDGDRQQRNIDLMMKSYLALEAEQKNGDPDAPFEREAVGRRAEDREPKDETDDAANDDGDVVKYRGRPIRRGAAGTPGAGSSQGKPTRFRGAGGKSQKRRSSDPGKGAKAADGPSIDKIKEALTSLAEMHEEGLITKAEFDAKRRQLLDRL